ncbi:MAG: arsenate reductase (glutaredoxin) [Bryobacterales bacterium]|nr:arsenate reductase (glutaredoxin) [Bryobacterales bacterium]
MPTSTVTIYHNPKCGTSVKVLALLRERGVQPEIVEYLKTPPTAAQWKALIARSGLGARVFLRSKEKLYAELDLANPKWTDVQLIHLLAQHPALLNRPVVASPKGVRPCRPVETVFQLLDAEKP